MECMKFTSFGLFILLTFINLTSVEGGVKTKTSSSRSQSRFGHGQSERLYALSTKKPLIASRECLRPLPPDNGKMRCSMENDDYKCTAECDEGYRFPSGFSKLTLTCDRDVGEWIPQTLILNSFPDCEIRYGDEDDYQDIGGNYGQTYQQGSDGGYSNSHSSSQQYNSYNSYQQQRTNDGSLFGGSSGECKTLRQPEKAQKECRMANGAWTCVFSCVGGFQFPDGSIQLTLSCTQGIGQWLPTDTYENCRRATSKESEDYGSYQQLGNLGGYGQDLCPSLQHPMNGKKQCSMSNGEWRCHITCETGYQFPDGNRELTVICRTGVGEWEPIDTFEDCLSISVGGYGQAHNLQTGIYGQGYDAFSQDLCPSLTHPPNGRKQCNMANGIWRCQVSCETGFQFPDGSTEIIATCETRIGQWSPSYTFENCRAISGSSYGHGYQIQQDLCPSLRRPVNGGKQCSMSNGQWKCRITCLDDHRFPDGNTEMTLICFTRIGQWQPSSTFEDCRSSSGGSYGHGYNQQYVSGSGGSSRGSNTHYQQVSGSGGSGGSSSTHHQQVSGSGGRGGSSNSDYSRFAGGGGGSGSRSSYDEQNKIQEMCVEPAEPKNGVIYCTKYNGQRTCQVTCNPGYEFADRSRQININCFERDGRWLSKEDFGDCQLLCHPPCEHGGTCEMHNQCSCTDEYRGNRCQYAISLCDSHQFFTGNVIAECSHEPDYSECHVSCPPGSTFDPPSSPLYRCTVNGLWNPPTAPRCAKELEELCSMPPSPSNGEIKCVTNSEVMQCSATCLPGHTFGNGFEELSIQCIKRTGEWLPEYAFPDCQAICSPDCKNGGKCLGHNSCLCPTGYRGDRCEYPISLCDAHGRLASVTWECQNNKEESICNVKCQPGQKLQPGHINVYKCRLDGTWEPDLKPVCVLAIGDRLIDPRTSHSSFNQQQHHRSGYEQQARSSYDYGQYNLGQNSIDEDYDFVEKDDAFQVGSSHNVQNQYETKLERVPSREEQGLEQFDITQHENEFDEHGSYGQKTNRNVYEVVKKHEDKANDGLPDFFNKEKSSDYKGICSVWGFYHFRTFDGEVFTYPSTCWHVISKSDDGDIKVMVRSNCNGSLPCSRYVSIQDAHYKYMLSYDEGVSRNSIGFDVPFQDNNVVVEYVGRYLVARTHSGYSIWINSENTVLLVADPVVQRRTQGICGNYDAELEDDFIAQDGTRTSDIYYFANSWKEEDPNIACIDEAEAKNPCNSATAEKRDVSNRANYQCEALKNMDFQQCAEFVDINLYYTKCQMDCCNVKSTEGCECTTLSEFVLECSRAGIDMSAGWRQPALCPLKCGNNMEYNECGPPCPATCEDQQPVCFQEKCVDGCHCPAGTVLDNGICISVEECPCRQGEAIYSVGDEIQLDCNTCVCEGGNWQCTDTVCASTCTLAGPHITTFDGHAYDFYGICPHYIVEADNFNVQVDYDQNCPDTESSVCVKSITIHTTEGAVVKMKPSLEVSVNEKEMPHLPVIAPGIYVGQATSSYMKARLRNGLEIFWDLHSSIEVYAPETLFGLVRGLCGTFTKNLQDEFLTPEGDVESSAGAFTEKWRVEERCEDVKEISIEGYERACDVHPDRREKAVEICQSLKNPEFSECHALVDYGSFYENCLEDVCSCLSDLEWCACLSFSHYANTCGRKGKPLSWRQTFPACGTACFGGQIYTPCANPCSYSCGEIAHVYSNCRDTCIEGCVCPQGHTLNEHKQCVSVSSCKCLHSGHYYPPEFLQRRGKEMCECSQGQWDCHEASTADILLTPPPRVASECDTSAHQVATDCLSTCPATCANFHHHEPCTVDVCVPGCKCELGYIMDMSTGKCVKPQNCPCHHAGRSYLEGEQVTMDCNQCVCTGGSWKCDANPCPGVCSAWGDSHFETFDGKLYDFDGHCDYVLVKARVSDKYFFTVAYQNVPCDIDSAASCGKTLTITLGDNSVSLTRTHPLPIVPENSKLSVTSFGMFVLVDTDIGISVQWDRNTRVYITAQPIWKNKLQGLCGDFNSDASDDFRSPSGGLPLVLSKDFADSWRVHKFCKAAKQPSDACQANPERRSWSKEKCGVLKSDLFRSCHYQVEVEDYYRRCVLDACACNSGGDCECLCAVVGAYALKCARKGVIIKWRSQELCPVQCEACDRYSPCISLCPPPNCENYLEPAESQSCSRESCVDGCEPKPCKPGQVHKSAINNTCVPIETCDEKPCIVIDGVSYREGERIENKGDACQSCYCQQREINCIGVPCQVVTVPTVPRLSTDFEFIECKLGWTEWINSNNPNDNNGHDVEDLRSFIKDGRIPCSLDKVQDIHCRVAQSQQPAELSGQDVTCNIENGFICNGEQEFCYDYEIRVFCECFEEVGREEKEGICPPGKKFTECAFDCKTSCSSLLYDLREKNSCKEGELCAPGCVKKECEYPFVSRDDVTCVTPDQCTCKLPTGFPLAPGQVVTNGCEKCQCLNNTVICDTILECKPTEGERTEVLTPTMNETFRVFTVKPRVLPVTTTSTPALTFKQTTPACSYWSDWINKKKPRRGKRFGDKETTKPYVLAQTEGFCIEGTVTNIECREVKSDSLYTETGEEKLVCDLKKGFICENIHQPDAICMDYKIRYLCTCEASTTTLIPIFIKTTTPAYIYPCIDFVPLINGPKPLPDSNIRASSSSTPRSGPQMARISDDDSPLSAWTAARSNDKQFIEIDLDQIRAVYGIITQGKKLSKQFVTSYQLVYSSDGNSYSYYQDENGKNKVFTANYDDVGEVKHVFSSPFEAKLVRIEPLSWEGKISLRIELLGCSDALEPTIPFGEIGVTESSRPTIPPTKPKECTDPIGLESGALSDIQFSASSNFGPKFSPELARLGSDTVWMSGVLDENQYIQIDFIDEANITGLKTRGREDIPQWVTSFIVEHSNDGSIWRKVKDEDGKEKEFPANFDPVSVVTNEFSSIIRARYLRIVPKTWKNWISMQIEILGCYNPLPCREPMGLDEGYVNIHQISSSSKMSELYSAYNGRLSSENSWVPAKYDHDQFIQVDLLEPVKITGIVTKGDPAINQWVTTYFVGYSNDSTDWNKVQDLNGKFKEFNGNSNPDSAVINIFPIPTISRYIRLIPNKRHHWTSVKLELLGCSHEQACREPMGLENGLVTDGQITASSSYDYKTTPSHARINDKSGWQPDIFDKNPYILIDLMEPRNVSAIVTKGIASSNQWTTKYRVLSSQDGEKFVPIVDDYGNVEDLKGNTDKDTPVINVFPDLVEARFFKIIPLEYQNKIGLRLELLGCYHPSVCQSPLGMESGDVYEFQISASSFLSPSLSPSNVRLDSDSAWVANKDDGSPFVQVDMLIPTNLTGLMTRGRNDANAWVKSYTISFSDDGLFWNGLKDEHGNDIEFKANYDSDSTVTNIFPAPIFARFLRVKPTDYEKQIGLRLEVLGCSEDKVCMEPMGLDKGMIEDGLITSSSFKSDTTKPWNARLNSDTSWSAAVADDSQYLQIDFNDLRNISAVVTKGAADKPEWVSAFEIMYSDDEKNWNSIKNGNGQPITFIGNTDNDSPVTNVFPHTVSAQLIQIIPKDWKEWISLRAEILGCYHPYETQTQTIPSRDLVLEVTQSPYGASSTMESDKVRDELDELPYAFACSNGKELEKSILQESRIEASSSVPGGDESRLPFKTRGSNGLKGGWVPRVEDRHPYLLIEFPQEEMLTSVHVKGREDEDNWVTSFRVIASPDNKNWLPVFGEDGTEVLEGNEDQDTPIHHYFKQPMKAKFIKIIPESWHKWPSLRLDVLVCPFEEVLSLTTPGVLVLCPELSHESGLAVNCPASCPSGTVCDGKECVDPVDCVCVHNGKIYQVSDKIIDLDCRECFCALGGSSKCVEKKCPQCSENERSILKEDCSCTCEECEAGKVLCPTHHECIPKQRWCDGIEDCHDDELNCTSTTIEVTAAPTVPTTPAPPGKATCDMMGKRIKTFDGQDITYDSCNHVVMKDIRNGTFNVTLHKECGYTGNCNHWLEVHNKQRHVKISSNLEVEMDGHNYTAYVLTNMNRRQRAKNFLVEKIGDQVIIKSLVKGYTLVYDNKGHLKIEVEPSLKKRLGGLCGFYSGKPEDDQKKPDDQLAFTSKEFGNSWALEGEEKVCHPVVCPHEMMVKALEECNKLKKDPFVACGQVLNVDSFVEFCMSSTCECILQKNKTAEKCKCDSFQPFVDECEEKLGPTAVRNWRLKHACHSECPPTMEWNDCGPSCQLTCDISSEDSLTECSEKCVSGCFCPPGTVLNEDTCIPPDQCADKTCQGFGDPHLRTFDGMFYPFLAEGTFLIVGDTEKQFTLNGFSRRCSLFSKATCMTGLQLVYKGHTVTIKKHKDIQFDEATIPIDHLPMHSNGMVILGYPGRTFVIAVPQISLEARYYEDNSGFAVKVPSRRYFNKTEGLCGNCNGKKDDETGGKPLSEYVCNFQTEGDIDDCKKSLDELPEITETNPLCQKLEDPVFEACHPLLDLEVYLDACSFDAIHSGKALEALCKTAMEYTRECCQMGIAINSWPDALGCDMKCPENLQYEQCHKGCPQTCASLKNSSEDSLCHQLKTDGCFCPAGKILDGEICVDPISCETCDDEGHVPGDRWKDGNCKTCECNVELKISCSEEVCPENPICSENEALVEIEIEFEESSCCKRYLCAPKKEDCPSPKIPDCPNGEVAKMHTRQTKCPEFECECEPALCGDVIWPSDLEVGQYVKKIDGLCCPKIQVACNSSSCPKRPACQPGTELTELKGECCSTFKCKPLEDVCIYLHHFEIAEGVEKYIESEESDPVLYKSGEEWQDGLCEKCKCEGTKGQHFSNCIKETCPDPSSLPDSENYVIEGKIIPGKCCKEFIRVMCIDKDGNAFRAGEVWNDEEDPCITYTCEHTDLGDVQITKNKMACAECPKNSELIPPSKFLGQCCGICHVTKCEDDDQLHDIGDTWTSEEHKCRVAECVKEFGSVKTVYTKKSCPIIPRDCPKNKIVLDESGCCEVCNLTSEIGCNSGPIPEEETIGFFTFSDRSRGGICVNDKPVPNLLKCSGACHSQSYYSLEDGDFKDSCKCCKVNVTVNRPIELRCPDGSRIKKTFLQPETCQCSKCTPKDPKTGDVKTIDFTKANRWSQSSLEDEEPFGQQVEQEYDRLGIFGGQQQEEDDNFSFDQTQQQQHNFEFSQQQQEDVDFSRSNPLYQNEEQRRHQDLFDINQVQQEDYDDI
nr:uncharacterized protein LOC107439698 isoform X4 [Parasteatoda tepidariorum]